ncbi:MAG: nucleotidyltransferase family protein [Ignavibacteriota bacterium]
MKKDLQNIQQKLRELIPYITQKYNVSSLKIFGSFVRNEQNSRSDVDILVSFSKVPSLLKFIDLKNYLSDQLQIKVDLVMNDSLKPRLRNNIINESVSI